MTQRSMIRRLGATVLTLGILGGLAACGGGAGSGGAIKIGLVTKTDSNPIFVSMRESAQAGAQAAGAELVSLAGQFDGDNEGQVTAIENLITQGVKGIMITPSNSTGILAAIKQARDAGILVIALDTPTEPADAVDATFATDNKAAGAKLGAWAKAKLGATQPELLMINATPGSTVDQLRHDGFLEGIGLTNDSPQVLGQESANGDQTKSQTALENLLPRAQNANLVYTVNEPAGFGAAQAIASAGKKNDILLGTIDGGCAGVGGVKDGTFGATVMQFPGKMASQGVEAIVKYAQDGSKPSGFVDTGSELIVSEPVDGVTGKDIAWAEANCWGGK